MFGQALGGREPVMQALTNLQSIGQEHGCDAVISVRLMHYPTTAGPAVVAYGTGVRFLAGGNRMAPAASPPQQAELAPEASAGDQAESNGASVPGAVNGA